MNQLVGKCLAAVALCLAAAASCQAAANNFSVFATGLNNPRGLKFGPDGNLYVAEGGIGGSNSTADCCEQAGPEVGPYQGSRTGARISKIDTYGARTTVIDNLPSSQSNPNTGSAVSGVSDVAFIGNQLYALLAGAGCSHGVPQVPTALPNGILRINGDGSADYIANLSAFLMANPVKNPDPDDFEPDGTWYSLAAFGGNLFAVEPNHGEIDVITPTGQIARIADMSTAFGHIVPTALAIDNEKFYIGNLGTFPIVDGSSKILEVSKTGKIKVVAEGLTTVVGIAFDTKHRMYVLEDTTGNPFPTPGTGKIVRVDHADGSAHDRNQTLIASGLSLPTAMTFGPDGALYVSNWGFGMGPGGGQVVRVQLPSDR